MRTRLQSRAVGRLLASSVRLAAPITVAALGLAGPTAAAAQSPDPPAPPPAERAVRPADSVSVETEDGTIIHQAKRLEQPRMDIGAPELPITPLDSEKALREAADALTEATIARVRHRFAAEDCRYDEMRRQLAIINNQRVRAMIIRARAAAGTISVADLRILDERVKTINEIYHESLARQGSCGVPADAAPSDSPPLQGATASPPATGSVPTAPLAAFPASDADLESLLARAAAYLAAANCQDLNCPKIDCEQARRAYQALLEAEDYLEELVKALEVANDNAVTAFRSESQASINTGKNIYNTQTVIATQQYFHRLGSILLDFVSIASFAEKLLEPGAFDNPATIPLRVNEFYQALKDAESLGATVHEIVTGESAPTPISGLVGKGKDAQFINDSSATATDLLSFLGEGKKILDEAKAKGEDLGAALKKLQELFKNSRARASLGQIAGRWLKNESRKTLEERQSYLRAQLGYAETEAVSVAAAFDRLQRVQSRRWAAIDALAAVREASAAYEVCLSRLCGTMSFERASIPDFSIAVAGTGRISYDSGKALRFLNAAIQATLPRLVPTPVTEDCPDLPDANTPPPPPSPSPPPSPLPPEAPAPPPSEEAAPQEDDEDVEDPETGEVDTGPEVGAGGRASVILDGFAGAGEAHIPTAGIGFQRAGAPGTAPETFAVQSPRDTDIIFVEGSVSFSLVRRPVTVTFGYAEGDARRAFAIPAGGGGASGIVYGDNAPSGSSGIATSLGLDGAMEVEADQFELVTEMVIAETSPGSREIEELPAPRPNLQALAILHATVSSTDYSGNAGFSGSGLSFSQERIDDIDETRFGAGLGATAFLPLGRDVAARLAASGLVYYRDTDLDSTERNLCSFCPAADRDFTLNIDDSDNGWGFRGHAAAGFEFRVSPRFSLTAGASLDYLSSVGGIFHPNSGDQVFFEGRTTGLRTESAWSWRAGVGVAIALGK